MPFLLLLLVTCMSVRVVGGENVQDDSVTNLSRSAVNAAGDESINHHHGMKRRLSSALHVDEESKNDINGLTASDEKGASESTSTNTETIVKVHANDGKAYNVSSLTALQIENYRQGTGLILNIHITHHGGTSMCGAIGRSPDAIGRAPDRACNSEPNMEETTGYSYQDTPLIARETASMIATVRQTFHFIGWEFGRRMPNPPLKFTEWENHNLFSIFVIRDPISRLLAGSGWVHRNYPNIGNGNATHEDWLGYANHSWFTNNYALRVLAGEGCCDGADTDRKYLENAKALVDRFSVVLDIGCLSQGIEAITSLLNITAREKLKGRKKSHAHAPSRERIGYDDVYEYLLEKNKLDIELYEWAKTKALIDCSALET